MGPEPLRVDEQGMTNLLTMLFNNKPKFPMDSDVDLIKAFGGPLGMVQINAGEKTSSTKLSKRAFEAKTKFQSPYELMDAIIGHTYFDVVMKTDLMTSVYQVEYPAENEQELEEFFKHSSISGISKSDLIKKIKFPVDEPKTLIDILKELEPTLCADNVPMLKVMLPQVKRKQVAVAEEKPKGMPLNKVSVEFGTTYLIKSDRPEDTYKALAEMLKISGVMFLCISRSNPKHLRTKYGIDGKLLWLTDSLSAQESSVPPSLESIAFTIEETLKQKKKTVVLLDGIEYLITSNTFSPVLKFARQMVDMVSESETAMLIPISPPAVSVQDLKNMEREMTVIGSDDKIFFDEDKFGSIHSEKDLEEAFDMDDSLELDEEGGTDAPEGGKPREKKDIISSLAKSVDRLRSISSRLKEDSGQESAKDTPEQKEQRTNIKNQIKDWKTEGYLLGRIEGMMDGNIKELMSTFNEIMDQVHKSRLLVQRLDAISIAHDDPRYTFLKGKLKDPFKIDQTETEIMELEDLVKNKPKLQG